MSRSLAIVVAGLALAGCTASLSPARSEDPGAIEDDTGKDDSVAAANVSPKLAPLLAFLRDEKNLVQQLGPDGTQAARVRRTVKVVRYTEFGRATDVAARAIARNYQVATGNTYRRAYGLVDLISVGDMYVQVKTGYGDDSFINTLVASTRRTQARQLVRALLPEASFLTLDHASTTSTGNYVVVLGDLGSSQAIVMTVEYDIT